MFSLYRGTRCEYFFYTKKFQQKTYITIQTLSANLRDWFDNCGVCEAEAICLSANLLIDGESEEDGPYAANGVSTDVLVYHVTWAVVANALIQSILANTVLQKAHHSVPQASQKRNRDKLKFLI